MLDLQFLMSHNTDSCFTVLKFSFSIKIQTQTSHSTYTRTFYEIHRIEK